MPPIGACARRIAKASAAWTLTSLTARNRHIHHHYKEFMEDVKPRLLFLRLLIVSIALLYFNCQQLLTTRHYSMKLAGFAPLCCVGGLFLVAFPVLAGKPTTAKEETMVTIVFAVGLVASLVNGYLMNPGFFRG